MLDSILIKPAGPDCNMDCRYCFYKCKSSLFDTGGHRMSAALLEKSLDGFMELAAPVSTVCFQGGEPTLMGLDFFRRAAEYVRRRCPPGKRIGFALQTNGLLLDDEFCAFLAAEGWLVGLSVDGPADIHDRYRVGLGGGDTHAAVMRAAERLRRHGVQFNTLTVITEASAGCADELFDFFRRYGSGYMQFIPCYETCGGVPAGFCCTPAGFGEFLCRAFDLWYNGGRVECYVRFFDELLISYAALGAFGCSHAPECRAAPVIEHNGDVYPCDFFVEPELRLGNVGDSPLRSMVESEAMAGFRRAKRDLADECRACRWRCLCNGDCRKNRIGGGLSYFCESYKMFFEYSHSRFLALKRELLARRDEQGARLRALNAAVGRNDRCPCGSGEKFKKCCLDIKSV